MNSCLLSFQLPRATAPAVIPRPLVGAVSATAWPAVALPAPSGYKARTLACGAEHRAQMLAQRRTAIRSSAKRW